MTDGGERGERGMHGLVVGATSWGCTLAMTAARAGNRATVLCRSEAEASDLRESRELRRLLPGFRLPDELEFVADPSGLAPDVVVWATPSQRLRENALSILPRMSDGAVHVSAAKGLERGSMLRMTEVLTAELEAAGIAAHVGVVSGPNLAREIAQGLPAATVAAVADEAARERVRDLFNSPSFRVYTNADVIGAEIGGALKNVIAIAIGMVVALELGDNARAALITRGLAEIARLGVALGGSASTFAGLAGLGDLLATAMSPQSRNRTLGERIGGGMTLAEAQAVTPNVVEGVETTRVVLELAERVGVSMPISAIVGRVLFEDLRPRDAIPLVMERAPQDEAGPAAG